NGYALYLSLGLRERRSLNRSVFERLWIRDDLLVGANLAPGYAHVVQDDLELRLAREARLIQRGAVPQLVADQPASHVDDHQYERAGAAEPWATDEEWQAWMDEHLAFASVERPYGALPGERTNLDAFRRQGSSEVLLVVLRGRRLNYRQPDNLHDTTLVK